MREKKIRRSGIRIMWELLRILGNLKYIIIIAVLGGWLGNACAIAVMGFGACCAAKLADPSFTEVPLTTFAVLTILAGILRGLLRFAEQYNNHFIAFKLLAALRDRIFGALRKLAPAKLEGEQKGAIISMLTSDVETLEVFYAHTISPILIAILVDGSIVVLVSKIGHFFLGLCALGGYLLIGLVIPFTSSALLKREGVEYRRQFADSSSYFLDSVKGIREIVQNHQQEKRGQTLTEQSKIMNEKTLSIKRKTAVVSALSNLAVSAVILLSTGIGISLVLRGQLQVAPMMVALVLLFSSFGPVLSLASLPSNLTQTFASGDRILNFMAEKPVVGEVKEGETFAFEMLSVSHLSFSYTGSALNAGCESDLAFDSAFDSAFGSDLSRSSDREEMVLRDVNLNIQKGSITGISGPSGCGKSTLLKLMLMFYNPTSGDITYNGKNLRTIQTKSLHENVVMVSQDTWLFNDTLKNNLLFVKPDASEEEVREACRKAAIDEFIMSLPLGYETEAGLLGDSLSAGEKQRIGLARAFLSGAPLILLDEVTSNVDAINEGMILKSLKEAAKEQTIVLVSHRESTMSICDRIYHMKEGRLPCE